MFLILQGQVNNTKRGLERNTIQKIGSQHNALQPKARITVDNEFVLLILCVVARTPHMVSLP